MNVKKLSILDKCEILLEEQVNAPLFTTNIPINNKYFEVHAHFFTSIGYISHQIALIENDLKQSMIHITDDFEAVEKQTEQKNLGGLLSLYELVFLAKFGNDAVLKEWFYAIKKLILKANKYRNVAVHKNWMFIGGDPNRPCYCEHKNSEARYVIVSPELMRERAIFAHTVFNYFNYIRAVTEDADEWDQETIRDAKTKLRTLCTGSDYSPHLCKKETQ